MIEILPLRTKIVGFVLLLLLVPIVAYGFSATKTVNASTGVNEELYTIAEIHYSFDFSQSPSGSPTIETISFNLAGEERSTVSLRIELYQQTTSGNSAVRCRKGASYDYDCDVAGLNLKINDIQRVQVGVLN